jgi:hypothetical protein
VDTPEQQVEVERVLQLLTGSLGHEKVEQMCSLLAERKLLRPGTHPFAGILRSARYTRSMSNCTFTLKLCAEDIPQCAVRLTELRESRLLPEGLTSFSF